MAAACLPAAAAPPADDATANATDVAFDALLSLPQGLPDDSRFPSRAGDGAPADEDDLRAVLDTQLKAGADVHAYRHGGTLLLHALRAGLEDTALWLLAHGADPHREVEQRPEPRPDGRPGPKVAGDDALQVALMFHRWRVVQALLRRPDLRPASDVDRAFRWMTLFDDRAGEGTHAQAVRELRRAGLPMPGGWPADCLMARALDEGLVSVVLALPAATPKAPPGHLTGRDAAVAAVCADAGRATPRDGAASGDRFADLPAADLARADARLSVPLMPSLVPTLAGARDVAAMEALHLRRPVADPGFVRALVAHALDRSVPAGVTRAVLAPVPPAALAAALEDPVLLKAWLARFAGQPVESYAWALQAVRDDTLRRHVDVAIAGTSNTMDIVGAEVLPGREGGYTPVTAAHWQALLARLPTPLGARPEVPLTRVLPEAAWPALFAHRYALGAAELAEVLRGTRSPQDFQRRWPGLRAASSPAAQGQAVALLLAPWSQGCAYEWIAPKAEDVARIQWLVAAGVRPPTPAVLAVSCEAVMPPALRASLLATQAVVLAPPAGRRRFVRDLAPCDAHPSPEVLRALAAGHFLGEAPSAGGSSPATATPQAVQAIGEPGRAQCAWLVSGGNVSARDSFDDESFYDGFHHFTPCLDATLYGELWHMVDGRVQADPVGEGATEGGIALREATSGRRYFLAAPVSGSTCDGGHPASLLGWTGGPGAQHLRVLGDDDADKAALQRQCHLDDPGPCFGLPSLTEADAPSSSSPPAPGRAPAWDDRWGVEDFIDHHAPDRRQAFVDAFLAMDVARLEVAGKAGVLPRWRDQALLALDGSRMTVQAKRQRTAWMFRDKAGMAASFGALDVAPPGVLGLVAWLPREDWGPMLRTLAGQGEPLRQLRQAATARKDDRLACVFSKALGEACAVAAP